MTYSASTLYALKNRLFGKIFLCYFVKVDSVKLSVRSAKKFVYIFPLNGNHGVDMENGDQVSKRGRLCPEDSRGGGVVTPRILGWGWDKKNPKKTLYTPHFVRSRKMRNFDSAICSAK